MALASIRKLTEEEIAASPHLQPVSRGWEFMGSLSCGNYPWLYERDFGFDPTKLFPKFYGMSVRLPKKDGEVPVLTVLGTKEDMPAWMAKENRLEAVWQREEYGLMEYTFLPKEMRNPACYPEATVVG